MDRVVFRRHRRKNPTHAGPHKRDDWERPRGRAAPCISLVPLVHETAMQTRPDCELARIFHRSPAATANLLAEARKPQVFARAGRTPSSRFDVVSTTPSASLSPFATLPRHLGALATKIGETCAPGQPRERRPIARPAHTAIASVSRRPFALTLPGVVLHTTARFGRRSVRGARLSQARGRFGGPSRTRRRSGVAHADDGAAGRAESGESGPLADEERGDLAACGASQGTTRAN